MPSNHLASSLPYGALETAAKYSGVLLAVLLNTFFDLSWSGKL